MMLFKNGVVRRLCGPWRDGATGGWRKLHNEEFHKLYSPPGITILIKCRRRK
jgi:hypothetical protein